jgi:parallel beta-helix repeat protein
MARPRSGKFKRQFIIESIEPRVLLSNTIYVDVNASGATHDGTSWKSAFTDLQQGLAVAVAGDEIHVADGTYRPTSGTDRTISFVLKSGVSLYGGYAGDGASNPDARDVAVNATILSGDIGTPGNTTDNSYHVLTANGISIGTVVDGVTATLGNANGSGTDQELGAGLLAVASSSLCLTNCTFIANWAVWGGGIYNRSSSTTLTNCSFRENTAPSYGYGGGIYNDASSPSLTGCTFSRNSGGWGGGMHNRSSSPTLTACDFAGNNASNSGGGMYNGSSSPILIDCSFNENNLGHNGGGMYNDLSSPRLSNCAFIDNEGYLGGAIYNYRSSASLADCIFIRNRAYLGAGIFNADSLPSLRNCAFSGNTAKYGGSGGGMFNSSSSPTLVNCAFSANAAEKDGSGMYNGNSSPRLINSTFSANAIYNAGSSPIFTNCIVWGSETTSVVNTSSTPTITYSNIQGGYTGVGNISIEPKFVRSPWTGSDGVFGTADDDYGDLRLRSGSASLDAGANAAIPEGVVTDFAGSPRIQNGAVDLGAYEGACTASTKVVYVDGGSVGANTGTSWTDAYTSLQSAILAASDGDTIRIADGTYTPTSGTDRTISFAIRSGVSIYAGYPGYGAVDPDARDSTVYATNLSGDLGTQGYKGDNSYHVMTATGNGPAAIIDGLTVTLGYNWDGNGAGLVVFGGSSLTVMNCTFSGNTASDGAGMYNCYGSPSLTNCNFTGNTAPYGCGGGMYNVKASPILTNCIFTGNTAASGGGMYEYSSSPTVIGCSFNRNTASSGGGAYNSSGSSTTLMNCSFSGNAASQWGGGFYSESSSILTNCAFSGNTATYSGGGMYIRSSSRQFLTNCTFIGNSASVGGGIYNDYHSSPDLVNCTFSANMASKNGGSVYNYYSSPRMTNCIVWGNGSSPIYNSNSTATVTYSDIQGGWLGAGNINNDPKFVRNPSPGADGTWGTADDDYGDLRLQAASPCIDAGDNTAVPTGVTTDLAGNPRIVDVPGVHDFGERVDMGAYEVQSAGTYLFDAVKPSLRMSFPFDVDPAALTSSDLVLTTAATGSPVSFTATVTYDVATRSATWQFQTPLPDGDYRATIPAGSVSDNLGNPLSTSILCNFFVLGGDANRDRVVDINDLAILAANWKGTGKVFSQGDFNYDGKVDAADLGILSLHWQQALPPPPASVPVSTVRAPRRTPVRMVSVVG